MLTISVNVCIYIEMIKILITSTYTTSLHISLTLGHLSCNSLNFFLKLIFHSGCTSSRSSFVVCQGRSQIWILSGLGSTKLDNFLYSCDTHRAKRWSILGSTLTVSHTSTASEYGISTTLTVVFHCYSLHVQGIHLFQILYECNSICCKTALKKPQARLPKVNKETKLL